MSSLEVELGDIKGNVYSLLFNTSNFEAFLETQI